jgi:hypothetical protein
MTIAELRKHRIFNIALFDLILTVVGMVIIFKMIHNKYYPELELKNFVAAGILLALPISIFAHALFGVNTQLNYVLGLSNAPTRL